MTVATNGSPGLGALAAALGALELEKRLSGIRDGLLVDAEVYLEASRYHAYRTVHTRRSDCRFDHAAWPLRTVSGRTSLETVLAMGKGDELEVPGFAFASELECEECSAVHAAWRRVGPPLRIESPGRVEQSDAVGPRCERCRGALRPLAFDDVGLLRGDRLPREVLTRPLSDFGLRAGEVLAVRSAKGAVHLVLDDPRPAGQRVVLVGCGNIGSQLVPHLGRLPGIGQVMLVDPDHYERRNQRSQDIVPTDVGRAKVAVQAERLAALAPGLSVVAIRASVEALPFGLFRDAVTIAAPDNRLARMLVNERAFRMGSRWIDLAVGGPPPAVRVNVYAPGGEPSASEVPDLERSCLACPCLECGWEDEDYDRAGEAEPFCRSARERIDRAAETRRVRSVV